MCPPKRGKSRLPNLSKVGEHNRSIALFIPTLNRQAYVPAVATLGSELRRIPFWRLYEKVSNTDEPPRHEANHRSVHERFSARTKSLVIFAHPPVLADPSDRPLHHPPTR